MAKPKGWTKRNRVFLNTPSSGCLAGLSWRVTLRYCKRYDDDEKLIEGKYKAHVSGESQLNDEAKDHFVSRKADLRALRNMRKELDAFESALEQAFIEAEEYNAES